MDVLPCKDILDEDSGLDGAFALTRIEKDNLNFKEKVLALNRVICSWHKIKNFLKQINTLKVDKNERERLIKLLKMKVKCRDKKVSNA